MAGKYAVVWVPCLLNACVWAILRLISKTPAPELNEFSMGINCTIYNVFIRQSSHTASLLQLCFHGRTLHGPHTFWWILICVKWNRNIEETFKHSQAVMVLGFVPVNRELQKDTNNLIGNWCLVRTQGETILLFETEMSLDCWTLMCLVIIKHSMGTRGENIAYCSIWLTCVSCIYHIWTTHNVLNPMLIQPWAHPVAL